MKTFLMVLLCCVFGSAQAGLIKKTLVVGGVVVAGSMAYAAKKKQRATTSFCQDEDYPGHNSAERLKSAISSQIIPHKTSHRPKRKCDEIRSRGVLAELYIREVYAEKADLRQVAFDVLCLAHDRIYTRSADDPLDFVIKKLGLQGLPRVIVDYALKRSGLTLAALAPDECSGDAASFREKRVLATLIDNAINHELNWLGGMCFANDIGATEVSQGRINAIIANCKKTGQNKGVEIKSVRAWEDKLSDSQ